MNRGASQQMVACFVNLNQSFSNLYELKFKGRKLLQEIINAFWERESMAKQVKPSFSQAQSIIFSSAIANCSSFITQKFSDFQEEFLKKYMENIEVMRRNEEYLSPRREQLGEIASQYDLLMHQLMELALLLCQQYSHQQALILKMAKVVLLKYVQTNREAEQLKQLMLHIGFETELDQVRQDLWKAKIFALSNQRYNSKKV